MHAWVEALNALASGALWHLGWIFLIGGAAMLIAMLVARFSGLPSSVKAWGLRLALLKVVVTAVWLTPVEIPLLTRPAPNEFSEGAARNGTAGLLQEQDSTPVVVPSEPSPVLMTPNAETLGQEAQPMRAKHVLPSWQSCAVALWFVSAAIGLVQLWRQWRLARLFARRSCKLDSPELRELVVRLSRDLHVRPPQLRQLDCGRVPCLSGIIKPTVFLPRSLARRNVLDQQLACVLAHELSHLRRNDLAWNWLVAVMAPALWIHPLWRIFCRLWEEQAELAADELALQSTSVPVSNYAASLLDFVSQSQQSQQSQLTLAYSTTFEVLRRRILSLERLNRPGKRNSLSKSRRFAYGAALFLIAAVAMVPWQLTAAHPLPGGVTGPLPPQQLADDEPGAANPPAKRAIKIIVTDGTKPAADATVFRNHAYKAEGVERTRIENEHYTTDATGVAEVVLSGRSVDLRLWVWKEGYIPLHAMWAEKFQTDGADIPAEFTFTINRGTQIGGVVVNREGVPIQGATVNVTYLMAHNFGIPGRPGERPVLANSLDDGQPGAVTDHLGRWSITSVPSDKQIETDRVILHERLGNDDLPFRFRVELPLPDDAPEGTKPRTVQIDTSDKPDLMVQLRATAARFVVNYQADSSEIPPESLVPAVPNIATKAEPDPLVDLHFVLAKHVMLHVDGTDVKIVNIKQLIELLESTAQNAVVYPHFMSTREGTAKEEKVRRFFWPLYRKLYSQKKITGSSWGGLSPAAAKRWDAIKSADDLILDPSVIRKGQVAMDGKAIVGAEVFLLPEERRHGVYLRGAQLRNSLGERVVKSDFLGVFELTPENDDFWIVALHSDGFAINKLSEMDRDWVVTLQRWGQVSGSIDPAGVPMQPQPAGESDNGDVTTDQADDEQEKTEPAKRLELSRWPVHVTSVVAPGITFHHYETEVDKQGRFTQRYIPPGEVRVGRAFKLSSGSMTFPEQLFQLAPGGIHRLQAFGPATAQMQQMIKASNQRHEQMMQELRQK